MDTLITNVEGEKVVTKLYNTKYFNKKIILFCHGFPGTNRVDKLKDNKLGIAEINYRGDKLSDAKFSLIGSMLDIKEVAKNLRKNYPQAQIYGLGYSYGGLCILNIIHELNDIFDKVFLLNSVIDAKFLIENPLIPKLWESAKDVLNLRDDEYYRKEVKLLVKEYNPLDFVKELNTEITIFQATEDEDIPIATTKLFYNNLKGKKKYISIFNRDHDIFGDEKELFEILAK